MAIAYPFVKAQFFDNDGNPLAGGQLYTYEAGSVDEAPTYTTPAGNVENTNPIILDSAGRADIFLSTAFNYLFVMFDAEDNELWSEDNISATLGLISGAVLTTTDQEVSGTKIWFDTQGFGDGDVEEYQSSSFPAVFGSQATTNTGIQIVGTGTLGVQLGSNEIGADAFRGGMVYSTSAQTLTLKRATTNALVLSAGTAAFLAPAITANGVAVLLSTAVIDIAHGGTGQTTAAAALNALLPAQSGQSGKFLSTDGSTSSWATSAGGPTFLAAPVVFYNNGFGTVGWQTYDSSNAGVPEGAKAIIIDYWFRKDTNPESQSYACLRVDNTKGNGGSPWTDTYLITSALAEDAARYTANAGGGQGQYPIRENRTFDYNATGTWTGGLTMRIVGYVL